MSRTPSDASPSPERFRTTSMPRTSDKVKEIHKGSIHDEDGTHHERLSYFQSPAPSPTYAGEDSTAPSLGMIMNALTELRKDMDKLKKENRAVKSKAVHNYDPQLVASNFFCA